MEWGGAGGSACQSQWAAESPSQSGGVGAGKPGLREAGEEVQMGGATGSLRDPLVTAVRGGGGG